MKDSYLIDERGTRTAVADLPTFEILALLDTGVMLDDHDGTVEDVYERLRIELTARGLEGSV